MEISSKKNIVKNWFVILQDIITNDIEKLENKKNVFKIKNWSRGPNKGGGQFRIFENGNLFEKVGVNFSEVYGKELPQSIISQRPEAKGHEWFATGTSMVLHPKNPFIPTVHLNYRYFEAGPVWWFGEVQT